MESKKAKDGVQSELDDLLIVFGDLEDQVAKQKVSNAKLNHHSKANPTLSTVETLA